MANVPQPIYPEPIEIDPRVLEEEGSSFADFTDELNSFTTSASPSVTAYPFENGRRYHAFRAGSYLLPNDDEELERLNIVHQMVKKVLDDRIFLAPLPEGFQRALDIGTGTGIWAMEMGDAYPQAEIIGNDLSPVQPSWVPPNVRFEVDDCESPWAYDGQFDFVFSRYMCTSLLNWPGLVNQAFKHIRPGGFVEFQDFDMLFYSEDGTLKESSNASKWIQMIVGANRHAGREPSPGPKLEGWMRDAGFEDIVSHKFKIPIGPWAKDKLQKEVGLFNLVQLLDGAEAISLRLLTSILKWKPEEVQVLCAKVKQELKSKSLHAVLDFYVVYGQKPL